MTMKYLSRCRGKLNECFCEPSSIFYFNFSKTHQVVLLNNADRPTNKPAVPILITPSLAKVIRKISYIVSLV